MKLRVHAFDIYPDPALEPRAPPQVAPTVLARVSGDERLSVNSLPTTQPICFTSVLLNLVGRAEKVGERMERIQDLLRRTCTLCVMVTIYVGDSRVPLPAVRTKR